MQSKVYPRELWLLITVCLLCFVGGGINGLVGTGSGIMFMLCARLLGKNAPLSFDMFALSLSCVLPVSVVSFFLYPHGSANLIFFLKALPASLLGGICGALLKGRLKTRHLSLIFACLTIYSGVSMILRAV